MPLPATVRSAAVLLLLLCLSACGSARVGADPAAQAREIDRLRSHLAAHPDDLDARADLGVLLVQTRQFNAGAGQLDRVHAAAPERADVAYHLAVAREALGDREAALALYAGYQQLDAGDPYRRRMEGRHLLLARLQARDEIRALLADEATQGRGAPPDVVAVLPLRFQGDDARYAPLARGLSEMLTVDLAGVRSLRLVERLRLQALLDELALARTGAVDAATAPRVGRLLGAGRLVGGTVTLDDETLLLAPDVVSLAPGETLAPAPTRGDLDDLFRLEKEMVFALLDAMDVTLTPEEQEHIERVPTRNLQAFLAYSQGLQAEDAGNYEAATGFFQQAVQLDPGFSAAGQAAGTAGSLGAAAPTPEAALEAAVEIAAPPTAGADVVQRRLNSLNTTIGSHFNPGTQDSREAAPEAAEAATNTASGSSPLSRRLPDPPAPPRGGN